MTKQSNNITKALQVLAKFEELVKAQVVWISIQEKKVVISESIIPGDQAAKKYWMKEAFLYFKFKAVSDFDENEDELRFISAHDGRLIARIKMEEIKEIPEPATTA